MAQPLLPEDARAAVDALRSADIVIGIPSYNNARTIGHVVRAAHAGLNKYFPSLQSVIVNSDGGSSDDTRRVVLDAQTDDPRLLLLSTPISPVRRLSFPYHGVPGKGSAFRTIFHIAQSLGARACAVVDSDLRSITPEWIDLLLRPILHSNYDFVAPYYHRHKYDGTITNSIVYPLTRALYGKRIRQPIGGDFGLSAPLLSAYLSRDVWDSDVARYGIDIWMTTLAVAEGFQVCQSFLGAKLHDAKDPGADLSAMLQQVVGSVFSLVSQYPHVWQSVSSSQPVELYGFRYDVGLDPIAVDLDRLTAAFLRGCQDLREIWSLVFSPSTLAAVSALAASARSAPAAAFRLDDNLWATLIYESAAAFHHQPSLRPHLVRSLTPLYLARVASFVNETRDLNAAEVECRIEALCLAFESLKPLLVSLWSGSPSAAASSPGPVLPAAGQPPAAGQTLEV